MCQSCRAPLAHAVVLRVCKGLLHTVCARRTPQYNGRGRESSRGSAVAATISRSLTLCGLLATGRS
eukprot:1443380-Pleurochrysis_carterae.AAC.1